MDDSTTTPLPKITHYRIALTSITCRHCGHTQWLEHMDALGADDGHAFCEACGGETPLDPPAWCYQI